MIEPKGFIRLGDFKRGGVVIGARMKYFEVFDCEHPVKNPMVCVSNLDVIGISVERFCVCTKFDKTSNIVYYIENEEDDGDPDDVLQNTDMLPMFSPRLISALNEAEIRGIEYIPVDVLKYNKEKLEGFCIANVIDHVQDAFVFEKSICQYYPKNYEEKDLRGKVEFIWRHAVDANKLEGHDIFRLKFDNRFSMPYSKILVSEKFKSIFAKNKFTGYAFNRIVSD